MLENWLTMSAEEEASVEGLGKHWVQQGHCIGPLTTVLSNTLINGLQSAESRCNLRERWSHTELGIVPVNRLLSRNIALSIVKVPKLFGTEPVKLFDCRSRTCSWGRDVAKDSGIVPLIWLLPSSMSVKLVRYAISVGISPDKLFLSARRKNENKNNGVYHV